MGGVRVRRGSRGDHAPPPDPAWSGRPPQGPGCGDPQRTETSPFGGPLLPLPPHGHLLEVRDPTLLRGAELHPHRVSPPPEVNHEEPAQRPPHRRRPRLLLAPLLRHPPRRPPRSAQPAH
eukprot:TRINITY_DN3583_c0_g1_i1.p2 TRINITY_DN3583_c0_g1~~TRINITY_DN3583_c0_g1_i1.p2  ORF type:complete len:120 (-),score=14.83 TRINITY_DN3583_c0_g1_i1:253-612(-)